MPESTRCRVACHFDFAGGSESGSGRTSFQHGRVDLQQEIRSDNFAIFAFLCGKHQLLRDVCLDL